MNLHGFAEAEPLDLRLQVCGFLAVAGERQRHRPAVGAQPRHRIDQQVGALDVAELADIDHVGGVLGLHDRIEFIGGDAVEHAAHQSLRGADGALIGVARERAFEQEQVGLVHQRAFDAGVDVALQRRQRKMQRAAMRRVDPDGVVRAGLEANEGAGLGAVAMQDVRLQLPDQAPEARPYQEVGRERIAANGEAVNAELEARGDFGERLLGAFAAGQAVGDDADVMAAVGLAVGQIEDMAKDPAHRARASRAGYEAAGLRQQP